MKKIIILSSLAVILALGGCGSDSMSSEQATALKTEISKMPDNKKLEGYSEALLSEDKQKIKIFESFLGDEQKKQAKAQMDNIKNELNTLLLSANGGSRISLKQLANTYDQLAFNPKVQNWSYYKNEFKPAADKILQIQPQGK